MSILISIRIFKFDNACNGKPHFFLYVFSPFDNCCCGLLIPYLVFARIVLCLAIPFSLIYPTNLFRTVLSTG